MIAKDFINYMVPPLKPSDPVTKAKSWMNELRIAELPIVDEGNFLGLINEDTILDANLMHDKVEDYPLIGQKASINQNQHFYDLLKLAHKEEVKVVAVVNETGHYVGSVPIEDIVNAFAQTSAIGADGAIIELLLQDVDYSLSEICRLIESNDAKVLASYVSAADNDPKMLKVTLKLNRNDLSHINATLEKFGYRITSEFGNETSKTDGQDRLDILMKYLSI